MKKPFVWKKQQENTKDETVKHQARFLLTWTARAGMVILAINILVALVGPMIAPHSAGEILTTTAFAPPGEAGLLGTDYLGRDLFSRMLHAGRLTIGLALAGTMLGFLIGMTAGFTAAEAGGWIDSIISRAVDVMISFPPILLALIIITGLGSSIVVLIVAIAIPHASRVARVSRAIAMDIGSKAFVEAARARGEGTWSIIRREILPNSLGPLGCEFGVRVAYSVLKLASLSFLGLGIQPPAADWGQMVRENMSGLIYGSWAALLPAAAIALFAVGINLIVDEMGGQTGREISKELLK
ncbi:MAG: ABC transporter permease [Desulfobacula sp.]|nr:ABC transporter permease [Desulfobacula sp.]